LSSSLAFRIAVALGCAVLFATASPGWGQTLVSYSQKTSFSSGLPEDTGTAWDRIGTGHALLTDDDGLLLNDNSVGALIVYQGLLGQLVAAHEVVFRGEVRVISNLGGEAALVEISRPGMELQVQLYPDHITVMERAGKDPARWLASVDVDLSEFTEIEVHKTSDIGPAPEQLIVRVAGSEILRVDPRATGDMNLGRVLFGSLGYSDLGATIWHWVEVHAELQQQKTPTSEHSVGRLKGRY
jgi:hypothetical protein